MINSHQFKEAAKKFRAGRISLSEFTDLIYDDVPLRKPNEAPSTATPDSREDTSPAALEALRVQLCHRPRDVHKAQLGRLLVVGGSQGMSGAIALSGLAAMRAGAGMVKIATIAEVVPLVAGISPCLMTVACPSSQGCLAAGAADAIQPHLDWADVIAVGPGLGTWPEARRLACDLYRKSSLPLVVDADGINALALEQVDLADHAGPRILTPHPGEFKQLVGAASRDRAVLEQEAQALARQARLLVVLKGPQSLITDGETSLRNRTGNPGMATAGSGDVLTGVVAAFLGQGLTPLEATQLAVHVHGRAGDLAAQQLGQPSMMATDLIDFLPRALGSVGP